MKRKRKQYRKRKDRKSGRYALSHRLLAAELLGRPLLPGEIVHHRDGDSTNNSRENLLVLPSQAFHAHIEAVIRREKCGQPFLFPELLRGAEREADGTLFDNVLP